MKKYIIITLFIFLMAVAKVNASTCVKDLNGDGVIDPQTEKWNCLATDPPICPQDMVNCTINNITLSGATSTAQTNVTDKIGITKISADAQGASLIIEGWSCSNIACSSASIGSIKIQNATVSGTVAADKISRMVGNGSTIQIFGCDGGTACAETLLGTINIEGSSVTGSAAADAGLISIVGSNSTLSLAGMTCNTTGCYQITAGTISISGINASCPLGSQYQCVNVSGVQQCSDLACNDDTFGGTVSPGQQICVKDINGDGYIDFSTEMGICQNYNNQYYCPLLAQNCSLQTSPPVCPPGGSVNAATKNCEITVNNNYICPATGTVYQDQSPCNANCILTQTIPPTPQYTCPVTNTVYQDQSGCNSNCSQTQTTNPTTNYTCSSSGTVYPDSSTCTTNCHHTGYHCTRYELHLFQHRHSLSRLQHLHVEL